jgi:LPS-assembly protein
VLKARCFPVICVLVLLSGARGAAAQDTATAPSVATPQTPASSAFPLEGISGCSGFNSAQWRLELVTSTHWKFTGQVEIECQQVKFFADEIEIFTDTNRLVARGNVVFQNPQGRISAEEADFDTVKMVGAFTKAWGMLSLGPRADRSQFGGQDPDVYFYGEKIEKLGTLQYKLTRGAFTTCVQPTPRWELTSGSVTINLDEYAVLRDMVLRVKGVPLFYLPYAYYPLQQDQRATGFLLPKYGASTVRGQSLSNAFFWAMGRSADLTIFHDWFTTTGQGIGTEYRYIASAASLGDFRLYRFDQHAADFTSEFGEVTTLPATRSFELTGDAMHTFPLGIRGRAHLDYFSSLTTQQLYHADLYDASRRRRTLGGTLNGTWGAYTMSATYQRNEAFEDVTSSTAYGSTPRFTTTMAPRRLFGLPIYAGANAEYGNLLYVTKSGENVVDSTLSRVDAQPTLRVPFSKLTFLTVNTSAAYRMTYYSESLDTTGKRIASPLTRSYVSLRSEVVGPVFTRIFDTPDSSFAERLKHVIEPTFTFDQVTGIDNYKQVVVLSDSSDFVVGGLTKLTYGLTNRVLARSRPANGAPGQAREFLSGSIQQTYYGTPEGAQFDTSYASSTGTKTSSVSPVAVSVRASPTQTFDTTMRMEYSVQGLGMQVLSLSSRGTFGPKIAPHSVEASWSRSRSGSGTTASSSNYLSGSGTVRMNEGRVTGSYGLNWDIRRNYIVSHTGRLLYNAQCCGIGFEYQEFHYPQGDARFPVASDRRINFSFMLAGLGTFENFFGAFGGSR